MSISTPSGSSSNLIRSSLKSRGADFFNADLRVVKYVSFGGFTPYSSSGARRLDFVIEFFNLFNRPNAVSLNSIYGSEVRPLATFGAPLRFTAPRQMRFSIDCEF